MKRVKKYVIEKIKKEAVNYVIINIVVPYVRSWLW